MRIGIIIGRIGGIDGVALETEKWIAVLEKLGHQTFIITGQLERDIENVTIVPELDFHHPLTIREQNDAFLVQKVQEETVLKRIITQRDIIEKEAITWIVKNKIDILLSENSSALPCHLSLGWAIKHVIEKTGLRAITHDHDYSWERGDRYKSRYKIVKKIIKECFPLNLPGVRHAVINSAAQLTLKNKFKIESMVVPNVMDFDATYAQKDSFNKTLPKSLNLKASDIPLFQITRIVRRKGIEVAIKLVSELDDPRIKLIVTGGKIDDHQAEYFGELVDYVEELQLRDRVIFAYDRFNHERRVSNHLVTDLTANQISQASYNKKVYSLSDAYAFAHACTYFSSYEGFGNAFVEAILAKRAIFVNNYIPVYWPEIGSLGFETVMLDNNNLTTQAISDIKEIIYNKRRIKEITEHNFAIGKKHFSYQVLASKLETLFGEL